MTYPFPPPIYPVWILRTFWGGLGLYSLLIAWLFFRSLRRPVEWWQMWLWLEALIATAVVGFAGAQSLPLLPWRLLLPAGFFAASGLYAALARLLKIPHQVLMYFAAALILLGAIVRNLPPVSSAREAAPLTECRNNLKQIGLAIGQWGNLNEERLPPPVFGDDMRPPRSWRIEILPFVGQPKMRFDYQDRAEWDSSENSPVARQTLAICQCPSNRDLRDRAGRHYTAYAFVTGVGTIFPPDGPLDVAKIPDGAANTILAVEACGQRIVWTEPRDLDFATTPIGINLPGDQPGASVGVVSAYHSRGVNVLFANDRVVTLSPKTDPAVLRAILTADGGETSAK